MYENQLLYHDNVLHSVLLHIGLCLFDIYTDIGYICYLFQQKSSTYITNLIIVFIFSLCLAICSNLYVISKLFRFEFRENKNFGGWFYQNSIIVICFLMLSLIDLNVLNIFVSRVFDRTWSDCPLTGASIRLLKTAIFVTICIENIPQLVVQILIQIYLDESFNWLTLTTLVVTILDLILICLRCVLILKFVVD